MAETEIESTSEMIFRTTDGHPIRCYIPPCAAKREIRVALVVHGGEMAKTSSGGENARILFLADPAVSPVSYIQRVSRPVYRAAWVLESVAAGKLLPVEEYRLGASDSGGDGVGADVVDQKRFPYTAEEDAFIIRHVARWREDYPHPGGFKLWKETGAAIEGMEGHNHSWMSLHSRWKNVLSLRAHEPVQEDEEEESDSIAILAGMADTGTASGSGSGSGSGGMKEMADESMNCQTGASVSGVESRGLLDADADADAKPEPSTLRLGVGTPEAEVEVEAEGGSPTPAPSALKRQRAQSIDRDPVVILISISERTGTSVDDVMALVYQCSGDVVLAERVLTGDEDALVIASRLPWTSEIDAKLAAAKCVDDCVESLGIGIGIGRSEAEKRRSFVRKAGHSGAGVPAI